MLKVHPALFSLFFLKIYFKNSFVHIAICLTAEQCIIKHRIELNILKFFSVFDFRPDLIQYDKLQKSNALYNLNNAFEVAEEKLGLTRLLDPEGQYSIVVTLSKNGSNNLR